jgi:hypothetical protein
VNVRNIPPTACFSSIIYHKERHLIDNEQDHTLNRRHEIGSMDSPNLTELASSPHAAHKQSPSKPNPHDQKQ